MIDKFTSNAQDALTRAEQIVHTHKQAQLDVEHILLALLSDREDIPARILTHLGANIDDMMTLLEKEIAGMPRAKRNQPDTKDYISLRAGRVLQAAAEEAERLSGGFVSTEHLLIAVAQEHRGPAAQILKNAGIDEEGIYLTLRGGNYQRLPTGKTIERTRTKTVINPEALSKPVGFSHAVAASGRMIFLAGQTATGADGRITAQGDVVGQYRQVLENLKAVMEEAGGEMADITKLTIFVKDRDDYRVHLKELGQIHKEFFGTYYPAMSLFEISRFFEEGVLVEIEGMAVIHDA